MQKWQTTFCFLASAGMIGRRSIWRLNAMVPSPSEHVRQAAVDQLIHAFGEDVAVRSHAQRELREILGGLPDDLQPAPLAVEAGVVTRAVQGLVGRGIEERKAFVRT